MGHSLQRLGDGAPWQQELGGMLSPAGSSGLYTGQPALILKNSNSLVKTWLEGHHLHLEACPDHPLPRPRTPLPPATPGPAGFLVFYVLRCFCLSCRLVPRPPSQPTDAAGFGAGKLQASYFHISRFLTESRWILSIHWTDKVSDLLVTLDKGKAFVEKINSL